MHPPIITFNEGTSLINNHTHNGPKIVSVNISKPTTTEGVDLAPIVTQINPKACWKVPIKNPINTSLVDTNIVSAIISP